MNDMERALQPDERTSRREAIKEALKRLDSTITGIEFLEEPQGTDERGNCRADLWLFRGALSVPPEARREETMGYVAIGKNKRGACSCPRTLRPVCFRQIQGTALFTEYSPTEKRGGIEKQVPLVLLERRVLQVLQEVNMAGPLSMIQ